MRIKFGFVLFLYITICSCTSYQSSEWKVGEFNIGQNGHSPEGRVKDGELLTTSAKLKRVVIQSGKLDSTLGDMINLKHPGCKNMKDQKLLVPIYAYLIRHGRFGDILIDTGCSSAYTGNPFGQMRGLLLPHVMSKTVMKPEEAIEKQLIALDVDINEIRAVFFTHLHFDHTSGVPVLPRPMIFAAGKGENSLSIPLLLEPRHFVSTDTIRFFDFDASYARDSEAGRVIDILGDSSLWAISTPGHSPGHVSYLVNTTEGSFLIAGDALMNYQSISLGAGLGKCLDSKARAQVSLDILLRFINKYPQMKVLAGHDFIPENYR